MSSISASVSAPISPCLAEFRVIKTLGHSGRVYLAIDIASDTPVVIKVVPRGTDHRVLQQVDLQRSLHQCGFSAPLLASWQDERNYYIVTPYYAGNDLAINLGAAGRFPEDRVRFIAAETVAALEELKANGVIHRDIKPGNVVFTPDGHIRLLDFGFAKKLVETTDITFDADPTASVGSFQLPCINATTTERVGTPEYMSPAAHIGHPYAYEVDYHALGVVIYQMLCGRLPFGNGAKTQEEVFESVLCEQLSFQPTDELSAEARDLLSLLLRRNSRKAVELIEIMEHPFFNGVRWDLVRAQMVNTLWKPFVSKVSRQASGCVLEEGLPCRSAFAYLSPELLAQRTAPPESTFNKITNYFAGKRRSIAAPPVPPSSAIDVPSSQPTLRSPPPSPPPLCPLPPVPTVTADRPIVKLGEPLPQALLDGLDERLKNYRPPRPTLPILLVTAPSEERFGSKREAPTTPPLLVDLIPGMSLVYHSPKDVPTPTCTRRPLPAKPVVKLQDSPKGRKRALKENVAPMAVPKPVRKQKETRAPLAAISVPQNASKPSKAHKRAAKQPTTFFVVKPSHISISPQVALPATPRLEPVPEAQQAGAKPQPRFVPGFKVGRDPEEFISTPPRPVFRITRPRSPLPASPVSPSPACFARAARAPGTSRGPRANALDTAAKFEKYVGLAEALATPMEPPHFEKSTDMAQSVPQFSSSPQACGVLTARSHAFSEEAKVGSYELNFPRINLKPAALKFNSGVLVERAKMKATEDPTVYSIQRTASPPVKMGPHYSGDHPDMSPQGLTHDLRRLWIRISMTASRALAWIDVAIKKLF
ncbi:hypothetical protein H0H87_004975 [Tephrocybe sp. NHM501043]|nr:hypothetical protein H0H87_004975 [Tephrocybe sp. NHM501043]